MADNTPVQILKADGSPFPQRKASAIAGGFGGAGSSPYDAANIYDQRVADWQPYLSSPDNELNMYRDRIVARQRDIVRNDGWGSGAVTSILDNVVGASFRPISKPDYRFLKYYTGIAGFDATWANEFGRAIEAHWRCWAEDQNRYCDASRHQTIAQMFRLGFRHKLIDGDALALMLWLPERVGHGRARYATSVQMMDPDRLSNPQVGFDKKLVRGGVKINHLGEAVGYYIRRAHQGDWFNAAESMQWDLIDRETAWGRPIVIHDFDHDRSGQHRGGAGVLTPVLQRLKMLVQYDGAELDAALINAIFGAYVQSPFDPELVQSALGAGGEISAYQQQRSDFHKERNISLSGARMPILFPGEEIKAVTAARPNGAFMDFEGAMLRNVAAAAGISYEQISKDWSKTNYSSARAALLEVWKTLSRRRTDFATGFAHPIYSCFVEESMDIDNLPMPAGAPSFEECRTAYSACRWLGPGRGWVDPVKERQGAQMGMEAGLSTLEMEAAESGGVDWEENLEQRALEVKKFKDLGLDLPSWAIGPDTVTANERT